ncbi:WXG100 family type VII secretion target [Actinoplanes friuliensis]|uniref:WXG100 family type VII secretion target n=1 Tax=Actinoplanes friuliensis TaxID=196914 RepID=UPI001EE64691|nr:WXG100 family type VII secretion target [Actinoplanes friuliensis]
MVVPHDLSTQDPARRQTIQESGVTSGVSETQAEAAVMAKTATQFEGVNNSLTSMLNKLMNELSVLQTAWVGSGGKAFETVKVQYQNDLSKLNKALADTAEAIKTSGISYTNTDDSAASMVTKSGGGGYSLPLEN